MSSTRSQSPPPPYPSTETSPLLQTPVEAYAPIEPPVSRNKGTERVINLKRLIVVFLLLIIAIASIYLHLSKLSTDPMDPEVRERIRRAWERETYERELRWDHQRDKWEEERLALEHMMEETRNHAEHTRFEWETEWRDHERMVQAEREHMDSVRNGWDAECQEHDRMMNEERRREAVEREEWERERRGWERMREEEKKKREEGRKREEEEKQREEEEERKRSALYWDEVVGGDHCLEYGAREYTGKLANIPQGYDRMKGCRETAVVIHGVTLKTPDGCQDLGSWLGGTMYGHWIINPEPSCSTYWGGFTDKGCTAQGSGLRRFESNLQNLQPEDDWRQMCSTTPADFRYMHFDSPKYCANWGKYGIYGIWEVDDAEC